MRTLPRSLDPLPGESLGGFLLRLSYRLRVAPLQLARLTGCVGGTSQWIGHYPLFGLDLAGFARASRLGESEARALTLLPWADRYPPIARSRSSPRWPSVYDPWLLSSGPRYCPACLVGDGGPVQAQYGGPWKKYWLLPVAFACLEHRVFLQQGCPRNHSSSQGFYWRLIGHAAVGRLHPAQCRAPAGQYQGRLRPDQLCGTRLDLAAREGGGPAVPGPAVLQAQRRLLALLDDDYPPGAAASAFTDLRVVTDLLCGSWPLGQDLMTPGLAAAADGHARGLRIKMRVRYDRPPGSVLAAAGLLSAAIAILDSPDLESSLARHAEAVPPGRHSRSLWVRVDRQRSACSEAMREAAERFAPSSHRVPRWDRPRAPVRTEGYRAEHVPAFLPLDWYHEHLALLGYGDAKAIRRAGALMLVQRVSGGTLADAARYLGLSRRGARTRPVLDLAQCLREQGDDDFTAALSGLAARLGVTPGLVNYRRRRQAMREWCLDAGTWQEFRERLPRVEGRVPVLDDSSRQEASALVWVHVTGGEPRYAPRPIHAAQPDPVRRQWTRRRARVWSSLAHPRTPHYAELCRLLTEHAERLAADIDGRPEG